MSRGREERSRKLQGHGNNRCVCNLWRNRGRQDYHCSWALTGSAGPPWVSETFWGCEGRGEGRSCSLGCDQGIRKRKKDVLQEGCKFLWYNRRNRHLSKAAWSMEQSLW